MRSGSEVALAGQGAHLGVRGLHKPPCGQVIALKEPAGSEAGQRPASAADAALVMYPLLYDNNSKWHLWLYEGVRFMREGAMVGFLIEGDRALRRLYQFTFVLEGLFDGRPTKRTTTLRIDRDSAAYLFQDMLGLLLDLAVTWDQLDAVNLVGLEVNGRAYMLMEETSGAIRAECIERHKGECVSGGRGQGAEQAPADK